MKFFILLFFSSFLYAQEPQSNNSAQGNVQAPSENTAPKTQGNVQATSENTAPKTQGDVQTPSENTAPKTQGDVQTPSENTAPKTQGDVQTPSENTAPKTQEQPEAKEKQSPSTGLNKSDTAPEQTPSSPQNANEAQKSATQAIHTVVPQPMEAPPEEPIPYYNPLHPQSPSTYQEGDLPSGSFSDMTVSKTRKHRFSIGGQLFDYQTQGSQKEINFNVSADYGYSRKYFEVGPYASIGAHKFDVDLNQFQDELMLNIGAFFEVNFMANANHAKNIPSIGLKAGYKRKEKMNYVAGQLYVTMKFFLNHQTAFFASLAPYYQYKLQGNKGEWGVEIPLGLRYYFY